MPSEYSIVGPPRPNIAGDIMPGAFSYSSYNYGPPYGSYGGYGARFNDSGGPGGYPWPGGGGGGGGAYCSPGGYGRCGGGGGYTSYRGCYPNYTSGSGYGDMRGGGYRGIIDPVNGMLDGLSFVPGSSRSRRSRTGRSGYGYANGSGYRNQYRTLGGSRYRSTYGNGDGLGYGYGRPSTSRPSPYRSSNPWNDDNGWDDEFAPTYGGHTSRASSLYPRRRLSDDWAVIRSPYSSRSLSRTPRRLPPLYTGAGASTRRRLLGARSTWWDDEDEEWLDIEDEDSEAGDSLAYLSLEDEGAPSWSRRR